MQETLKHIHNTNENADGRGETISPVLKAVGILRYRFFLFAGLLPYAFGAVMARSAGHALEPTLLAFGAAGVFFAGLGVEGVNEFFDHLRGGDRVFLGAERKGEAWHLPVGVAGFLSATGVAVYLSFSVGWALMIFAALGMLAALAYLTPPFSASYRGAGETVIALAYGPGITLGAYYLFSSGISARGIAGSMLPALMLFALAIVNEIPDFYGDRLVGKRNIVVRVGRRRAAHLFAGCLTAWFIYVIAATLAGLTPPWILLNLAVAPLAAWAAVKTNAVCESPAETATAVKVSIVMFVLSMLITILGYMLAGG